MIFYFSGTGNSYAAAMQLQLRLRGELLNIADCVQNEHYQFALQKEETIGFVFPVYYGGLPSIVAEFLAKIQFDAQPEYAYGVLTYGGTAGDAAGMLTRAWKEATGCDLSAFWQVRMPANYAILYEPTSEQAAEPILEAAGETIEWIVEEIQKRSKVKPGKNPISKIITKVLYPRYDKARVTAPFYTDDQCVHCGICAGRCPVKAIEMIDGTPTWVKDQCVFCMSCVRCGAIQYGQKMIGRYRYRHPVYQKKKKACCDE